MRTNRPLSNFFGDCRGSLTVEFVVLVPMLLAALIFSFDFGRAFWAYDIAARDVRAAVRYYSRAAITPSAGSCPTATQNVMTTGDPSDSTDVHFPWKGAMYTCNITVAAPFSTGFNQTVSVFTITATVPYTLSFVSYFNSLVGGGLSSGTYTMSVADQARSVGN